MRRLILTLAVGVVLCSGAVVRAEILDGVAAIVNDKIITYSDVKEYIDPVIQQLRGLYSGDELMQKVRSAQYDALSNLVERALILQEYKAKGYNIPDTVIQTQLNDIIAGEYGGDRAAFIKTLEAQHLTLTQYRDQLRDRVIVQAMRNRKTQQEVVVSPYKIEKYYQDHIAEFKVDDMIKLRMIYIKKTGAEVAADESRKLGDEIFAKLKKGESFESLAKQYSQGKEASLGGDWGWIGRGTLRKELDAVAFGLPIGKFSEVIDTTEGIYLLHVEDIKMSHTKLMPDVREEIEKILLQQERAKTQAQWVKDLRAKAFIRLF